MPPTVAECRRSLGQILGQPLLLWERFSQLCVSDLRRRLHSKELRIKIA
jgi:hypothetical protein